MSIYLLQNEQQTGPFTDDQIQQMLRSATVPASTLGWKEGMAGWEPLSSFVTIPSPASPSFAPPSPGTPLPPARRSSPLGLISFIVSLVTAPIWFILLAEAGMAHNAGTVTPTFNMIVGFLFIGGLFVNLAAIIVGVVAAFIYRPNTMAILGACLSALILIGLVALICLGLAMKHAAT
jgi:hypothetical protein